MSTESTTMQTQAAALETAVSALATAYSTYLSNLNTAYGNAESGNRPALNVVGKNRLDELLASRMRVLGLQGILEKHGTTFVVPATWATALSARIGALLT